MQHSVLWQKRRFNYIHSFFHTGLRQHCGSVNGNVAEMNRGVVHGAMRVSCKSFPHKDQVWNSRKQSESVNHVISKKHVIWTIGGICATWKVTNR